MKPLPYFAAFFDEKDIDLDATFEVTDCTGRWNLMSYGAVVEAIKASTEREQNVIANTLREIDFRHADVRPYLRHLGKCMADVAAVRAQAGGGS